MKRKEEKKRKIYEEEGREDGSYRTHRGRNRWRKRGRKGGRVGKGDEISHPPSILDKLY